MKKLRNLLLIVALVLSHAMFAFVAYSYRDMLCGIEHFCYSAPASVAFLDMIPFSVGIIVCLAFVRFFRKRAK